MPRSVISSSNLRRVSMSMGVEGIDEIKKGIGRKLDRLSGVEMKRVFMRAALVLVKRARSKVHSITGRLVAGIFASYGKAGSPDVLVGVSIGGRGKAPHGGLVERGHKLWRGGRRKQGQGRSVGEVPPHPYFNPAREESTEEMAEIIVDGLKNLIEQ